MSDSISGGASTTGAGATTGGGATTTGATAGGGSAAVSGGAQTALSQGAGSTVSGGGSTVAGGSSTTTGGGSTVSGAAWRDDWRDEMARDQDGVIDTKYRAQLERFTSPQAVATAHRSLQGRFDRGEFVAKLPDKATADEIAAYRKTNGIPEKPEGYLDNLPKGIEVPESDKRLVTQFVTAMHGQNASPSVVHAALQSYYGLHETVLQEQAQNDERLALEVSDALHNEMGRDWRGNMNAVKGLIDGAPKEAQAIAQARMPDGTPVMSNPHVLRWLVTLAREINPAAAIIPGSGGDAAKGVDGRIAEIEGIMRKDRRAYDRDEKMQAELRDLYTARERLNPKAA